MESGKPTRVRRMTKAPSRTSERTLLCHRTLVTLHMPMLLIASLLVIQIHLNGRAVQILHQVEMNERFLPYGRGRTSHLTNRPKSRKTLLGITKNVLKAAQNAVVVNLQVKTVFLLREMVARHQERIKREEKNERRRGIRIRIDTAMNPAGNVIVIVNESVTVTVIETVAGTQITGEVISSAM